MRRTTKHGISARATWKAASDMTKKHVPRNYIKNVRRKARVDLATLRQEAYNLYLDDMDCSEKRKAVGQSSN